MSRKSDEREGALLNRQGAREGRREGGGREAAGAGHGWSRARGIVQATPVMRVLCASCRAVLCWAGYIKYCQQQRNGLLQSGQAPRPAAPPVPVNHPDFPKFIDPLRVQYLRLLQHERIAGCVGAGVGGWDCPLCRSGGSWGTVLAVTSLWLWWQWRGGLARSTLRERKGSGFRYSPCSGLSQPAK